MWIESIKSDPDMAMDYVLMFASPPGQNVLKHIIKEFGVMSAITDKPEEYVMGNIGRGLLQAAMGFDQNAVPLMVEQVQHMVDVQAILEKRKSALEARKSPQGQPPK